MPLLVPGAVLAVGLLHQRVRVLRPRRLPGEALPQLVLQRNLLSDLQPLAEGLTGFIGNNGLESANSTWPTGNELKHGELLGTRSDNSLYNNSLHNNSLHNNYNDCFPGQVMDLEVGADSLVSVIPRCFNIVLISGCTQLLKAPMQAQGILLGRTFHLLKHSRQTSTPLLFSRV